MALRLLEQFAAHPAGLTAEEAAYRAGFDRTDGAWKRVSDLRKMGFVTATGRTRIGAHSNRQHEVLTISQGGKA